MSPLWNVVRATRYTPPTDWDLLVEVDEWDGWPCPPRSSRQTGKGPPCSRGCGERQALRPEVCGQKAR